MMIKNLKIGFLLTGLFLLMSNQKGTGFLLQQEKEIIHTIRIADPVKKDGSYGEYSLVECINKDDITFQYYMDVISVYCTDSICKVVPFRVFWDILGRYHHYELDSKYKLEKERGKPFRRKNYKKLNAILQDKNSPLRNISVSEITLASSGEGVDAISGPTAIVLADSATVKGATLTCYTLWHWVYGNVVPIIRDITGNSKSIEELALYLKNEDEDFRYFALQQIVRRKIYEPNILNEVLQLASNRNNLEQKLIIEFLEGADDSVYYSSIEQIMGAAENGMRVRCLNSMLNTRFVPPVNYYEELSKLLPEFDSFQEIDLLITLLEKNGADSTEVVDIVFQLLNDKNIVIARRAYWFLKTKELTQVQNQKLKEFYSAHAEYL